MSKTAKWEGNAIQPDKNLRFIAAGYTVILEGDREALSDILPEAAARLWKENSRAKPKVPNEESTPA